MAIFSKNSKIIYRVNFFLNNDNLGLEMKIHQFLGIKRSDWSGNESDVFTFVFVLETSVASSHLLTSFIDVINWFSTNESIFLVNVIIVSQTVATVVAVETKTRTSGLGTVFEFLTKTIFLEFCHFEVGLANLEIVDLGQVGLWLVLLELVDLEVV